LSPRQKCDSVSLATMSCGKLFHSRAPATAKAQSPTVEHCDWRASSWSVSDDLPGSAHYGLLWGSTVGYPSDSLASCCNCLFVTYHSFTHNWNAV